MVEEDVKVAPGLETREGSGGKKVLEMSSTPHHKQHYCLQSPHIVWGLIQEC